LNLGGPGWFRDIFEIQLDLENEHKVQSNYRHVLMLLDNEIEYIENYKPQDIIKGSIKIKAPPGKSIWQDGIYVMFHEVYDIPDMLEVDDLNVEKKVVDPVGIVSLTSRLIYLRIKTVGGIILLENYFGSNMLFQSQ